MSFSSLLIDFFTGFTQTADQKSFFSYHILTNILSINYNCFVKKQSPSNIPFRKLSEHSKTTKEHVLIKNVLVIRFFSKSLRCKDMAELCYIKCVQKQLFPDVLQNRCPWKICKIHRKTSVLDSLYNKVESLKRLHHKCFLWFLQNS